MLDINSEIERNRKNFLLHNIVRLREMIRYLPPEKLTLFKEIPFLIHVNSPHFPGYVEISEDKIFGVWNFENSGFAKDIAEHNPAAKELLSIKCDNPAVQAIYHIGSLGTFTQSAKSDFDFWVVIEKYDFQEFGDDLLNVLHEKLALITTYSRKSFSQEVTFFVHYAHNLRENIFDNTDDETVAVPPLLLKEEFYRTFIMVAGKIPLWAVQPLCVNQAELDEWKKEALANKAFIDLGTFDSIPIEEVQRGLLWQICKAPYDPVKSVIKASITASYNANRALKNSADTKKSEPILLCDMVKKRFGESIIDDYAADPYIIAFERILQFYTEIRDQKALSQIKAAIFFRLCGFPVVTLPRKGSPKRKILDRYVRIWQLSNTRLKKLLEYQSWPESEKTLFDQTMVDRLSMLYKTSLEQKSSSEKSLLPEQTGGLYEDKKAESLTSSTKSKPDSDLKILKNKVSKITIKKKDVIPKCSTYLSLKPQRFMAIVAKYTDKNVSNQKSDNVDQKAVSSQEWLLFSAVQSDSVQVVDKSENSGTEETQNQGSLAEVIQDQESVAENGDCKNITKKTRYKLLYSEQHFMKVIGWSFYNHLYIRGTTQLEIKAPCRLYGSLERDADCDDIYLALQPWLPLSDEPFLYEPFSEKIIIVLIINKLQMADEKGFNIDRKESATDMKYELQSAEFLIRNSWGEIFFEVLALEQVENLEEKCYQTAMKILKYHGKGSNYAIFQLASKPVPKLIQRIKTIVEDIKAVNSDISTFENGSKTDESSSKTVLHSSQSKSSDIKIIQRRLYLDAI